MTLHFHQGVSRARVFLAAVLMAATAAATAALKPAVPETAPAPNLDVMLPAEFGDWRRIEIASAVLPAETELGPGEAVAYRAYRDRARRIVTLVVAYGPPLGDSVRLHRPENCYVAQGYAIRSRREQTIDAGDGQ